MGSLRRFVGQFAAVCMVVVCGCEQQDRSAAPPVADAVPVAEPKRDAGPTSDQAANAAAAQTTPKPEEKRTAATPVGESPSLETIKAAESKLVKAKALWDANHKDFAKRWFKEIVEQYPGTSAADEAAEFLK